MASLFFFIGKKDGGLRPCQDYRRLNEGTIKNRYPLPLISELVDKLKGAKYFTKLDLRWGYNNVRIKEGDEWKAAFKTNKGLFEPMVLFFGLCNAPATFQQMMNEILRDMMDANILVVYMDDILLFAQDKKILKQNTVRLLERLTEHDLFLKPEKCSFEQEEIEFLGMIIKEGQVKMDPRKLKGFCNFYRWFITHYADIAKPLHNLTKKDSPFQWGAEQQKAFDTLKNLFLNKPILLAPDTSKLFPIETDASKVATGGVLKQQDTNGDWHPVAYLSQSLDLAQCNYQIYDRELLAIIRALQAWRHYLLGNKYITTVYCDHRNLTYYREPQKLTPRQARWQIELSQFDIHLVHKPGKVLVTADALSRRPDLGPTESTDKSTLLPPSVFISKIDTNIMEEIRKAPIQDDRIKQTIEGLMGKSPLPQHVRKEDWTTENGLIYYQGRCYVPDHQTLRRDIIKATHDTPTIAHPGQLQTLVILRRYYWWPGMYTMVKKYIEGCAPCQQMKINTHPTKPLLIPIQPLATDCPFITITMDFITDLPESRGFNALLVIIDHGNTKGMILNPCRKDITAEEMAELIHTSLYRRFGLPRKIISDRGTQFAAQVFREWQKLMQIDTALSTAYHPQTDGETERANQEVETYLRIYCGNYPKEWAEPCHITNLEFSHNYRTPNARNQSPFYLMMGYHPKAIPKHPEPSYIPDINKRLRILTEARREATATHELARVTMAKWNTTKYISFKKGERVWLEAKNIKTNRIAKKLAPKREGPFTITSVLSPVTFQLELPEQWKIHDVFHVSLLTPFRENDVHGPNFLMPPPDILNDEEEWEIENIIKYRWIGPKRKRQVEYLIAWKGYPSSKNRWEKEELLKNAPDILRNYITNPDEIATAVAQIHDWIRKSPANRDQILTHFAVLHAQGDPLCITAFTLLTSGEIADNLRGGSSNLSRAVESMHQAVQYLNQAAEDNLATMTLLTYPLARSDPPRSPPPPPQLPLEVATTRTLHNVDDGPEAPPPGPPTMLGPAFSLTTPAVVHVTQTVTTTPDSPPYQPQETPPSSPPTTPRPDTTHAILLRHRTSPHLSIDSQGQEQITQAQSPSPPSYFCQRWDCHSRNKQTYSQVETYGMDEGPETEYITVVNLCFRCNRECLHFINGQRIHPYRERRIIRRQRPTLRQRPATTSP
ncbi:hypothetical protein AX16_009398 [Volvariella volvacea WC 439]|nr:hypothetical protein AX16_009398 [Volvariella volvacea WC 439]